MGRLADTCACGPCPLVDRAAAVGAAIPAPATATAQSGATQPASAPAGAAHEAPAPPTVRFASFNASLNRSTEGELVTDLSTPDDTQAANVAEIIQRTRPDVLLINEFDYDTAGTALALFQDNYLSVAHNGAPSIRYAYRFAAPSNTGIPSGFDLNNDGTIGGGGGGRAGLGLLPRPVWDGRPLPGPDRHRGGPHVPDVPVEGQARSAAPRRPEHARRRTTTPPRS